MFVVGIEAIKERLDHYAVLAGLGHKTKGLDLGEWWVLARTLRDGTKTQERVRECWGEFVLSQCMWEPQTASARLVREAKSWIGDIG